MSLELPPNSNKEKVFSRISGHLGSLALRTESVDFNRPWGGFFVIDEAHTDEFISQYFPDLSENDINKYGRVSPKILAVEPGKRLSWQYHDRRGELWRVIDGPAGVITSYTDEPGPLTVLHQEETIQFEANVRHRLVGLDRWGIIAEIWQHVDLNNLSTEDDIVRVEDDFNR